MKKLRLIILSLAVGLTAACFWQAHFRRDQGQAWIIVLDVQDSQSQARSDSLEQIALLEAVRVMPHQVYIRCCDTIQCQYDLDQRAIVEVSMDISVEDSSPLIDRWQSLYAAPQLLNLLPLMGKIDFSEPLGQYDSLRQELQWWLISLEYEGLEQTFFNGPSGDVTMTEIFCNLRAPHYDSAFCQSLDWGTINGRLQLKRIFRTY